MTWFGGLVVFTIVWWLVFFVTLPFGVRRIENPEQGHDAGAPAKTHLLIKAAITTALAGAVTGGLAAAVAYDLIDVRELLF